MKIQILNSLGVLREFSLGGITQLRVISREGKDILQYSASENFDNTCHEWKLLSTYHEWESLRRENSEIKEKYLVLKFKVID